MKYIIKNWKTSLIGVMIIIGLGIEIYRNGMNIHDAIFGLMAIGFLSAKDADKSHTTE